MAILNLDTATVHQMHTKYPILPLTALSANFVFTAAGAAFADGAEYTLTGKEIVLIGGGAAGGTVTVTSVADSYNRTGNITTYAVAANLFAVLPQFQPLGWSGGGTAGKLHLACSDAAMTIAVIRLAD